MQKNKLPLILALISLLLIGILAYFFRFIVGGSEDAWICVNGEWLKHGNPNTPKPLINCE